MYFWKIKALKEDLRKNVLTSREHLYYLLAYITLYSIFLLLGIVQLYESLGMKIVLIQLLILLVGMYYAYYSNGGLEGKNFSHHYFSIAWVFLMRATVFMGLGMLNLYVMTYIFGFESLLTVQNTTIIALLFELIFYWRIGKHIKSLRL